MVTPPMQHHNMSELVPADEDPTNDDACAASQQRWVVYYTEDDYPYYFNTETGESQWDQPEDFDEIDDEIEDFADPEDLKTNDSPEDPFINELMVNNVFSSRRVEFCVDGTSTAPVANVKLEFLRVALQSKGSDEQWHRALSMRDYLLPTYLLNILVTECVNRDLQDAAAHCLAFAGQICADLWRDFAASARNTFAETGGDSNSDACVPELLTKIFIAAQVAVCNIQSLEVRIQRLAASKQSQTPYAGFDVRDVAAYNLSDDYNDHNNSSSEEQRQTEMDACRETVMVYLLLLFQMFCNEITSLTALVRVQRTNALLTDPDQDEASHGTNVTAAVEALLNANAQTFADDSQAGIAGVCINSGITKTKLQSAAADVITVLASSLMHSSLSLDEEAYLQALKAVTALNYQLPPIDLLGATELTNYWSTALFAEEHAHQQLSEGVLHLVNDIGYPSHRVPEALPILKFISDLIESKSADGYFCTNDIKLLVDIAIRELTNFGLDDVVDEPMVIMYIRLLSSVVSRSSWSSVADHYRKEELVGVLEKLRSSNLPQCKVKSHELIGDINLL